MKRITLVLCLFLLSCPRVWADAALDAMTACQDLQSSRIPVACVVSNVEGVTVFSFYFEDTGGTITSAIVRVTAMACASGPVAIMLVSGKKALAASCSPTQDLTDFVPLDLGIKS